MDAMTTGAMAMGYAVAGLFFLRFWRDTRDRLFALFALAFLVLAVNRVVAGVFGDETGRPGNYVYWVRLAAFALILAAIVDKNRARKPAAAPRPATPHGAA